ncbi:hypothetical protein ACFL9T_00755 [Thermodesulfobacteriota bacterium]
MLFIFHLFMTNIPRKLQDMYQDSLIRNQQNNQKPIQYSWILIKPKLMITLIDRSFDHITPPFTLHTRAAMSDVNWAPVGTKFAYNMHPINRDEQ